MPNYIFFWWYLINLLMQSSIFSFNLSILACLYDHIELDYWLYNMLSCCQNIAELFAPRSSLAPLWKFLTTMVHEFLRSSLLLHSYTTSCNNFLYRTSLCNYVFTYKGKVTWNYSPIINYLGPINTYIYFDILLICDLENRILFLRLILDT